MIEDDAYEGRNRLISLVRYAKMTPDEAEAEAKANGWPPFAHQPPLPEFDPLKQSRWPLVMAVAWIAWRDLESTREQCPEFRAECTHWIFREWKEPVSNGKAFKARTGWFLETLSCATAARLTLHDLWRTAHNTLPPTRQMSVRAAEQELWQSLSDGKLVAEGLNEQGKPVDIPQREWSYLKLFEEWDRDVLKYEALNREAFSQVKLKRDELLSLWPRISVPLQSIEKVVCPIEPQMLAPIADGDSSGFVPLCTALQWIMTDCGRRAAMMDDAVRWYESVREIWPYICDGQIEIIGLQAGHSLTTRIPGEMLTVAKVLPPIENSIDDILLNSPSHIACTSYINQQLWERDFTDTLYETGRPAPAWTHLQIRKSQILERWPRSPSFVSLENGCYRWLFQMMQAAPSDRPKSRAAFLSEAKTRFEGIADRQFHRAWQRAIADSGAKWSKSGRPKSNRSGS